MDQLELSVVNRLAWESSSYEAWVNQYGTPSEAAQKIKSAPAHKLRRLSEYLPELQGCKVANPLGSHGRIATALALLGANVTVFDISRSNARYASELFDAAEVTVEYISGEFQALAGQYAEEFEVVVMELGVVHYFIDIDQFVAAVRNLVRVGGLVVLNDFHPIVNKSISINSSGISVTGSYFSTSTESSPTPYEDYVDDNVPLCFIRRWNLGEIVTAFAEGGFRIDRLVELPSSENEQLPGTFTLKATAV